MEIDDISDTDGVFTVDSSGWTPVVNGFPPADVPVWLYEPVIGPRLGFRGLAKNGRWGWGMVVECWHDGEWNAEGDFDKDLEPTHWHALPEPPVIQ